MSFEAWFSQEQRAGRLYWADYEGCRAAWKACEAFMARQLAELAETAPGVA